MKKLILLAAGLALLAFPMSVGAAGVDATPHDLGSGTVSLCESCHIPHQAVQSGAGGLLWAQDTTGVGALGMTTVAGLCYSCHQSGGLGAGTGEFVFTGGINHTIDGTVITDCSGSATDCHDVHDNDNGSFLTVTATNGTYCETCHDSDGPGTTGGDHTAGMNHTYTGITCNGCHTPHDAASQSVGTETLLLEDNYALSSTQYYYGRFCSTCHGGNAPTASLTGYGGVAASDVHAYAENRVDGAGDMHPSTTTTDESTTPTDGCNKCHDVHNAGATVVSYILKEDNANSAYCISCHALAGAPSVGNNTHFVGVPTSTTMNVGSNPFLPWANQIDEDAATANTADWTTGVTANMMVCETCHSVHRKGQSVATGGAYALRDNYDQSTGLCSQCHTAN